MSEREVVEQLPVDTIICGNNADVLQTFPDDCIDLTVTSPPYDNLRRYKGYSWDFEAVARQLYRVTKPRGIVVWIVADATIKGSETGTSFRQALFFMDIGFKLLDTMIWYKPNPTPQEQHPRYQPAFDYMFVFCKGYPPRVFHGLTKPNKYAGKHHVNPGQRNAFDDSFRHPNGKKYVIKREGRRHNVWIISTKPYKGHSAAFPEELARDHILSWTDPGDLVLDPFVGSGTTCVAAKRLGRHYIGIDISDEYCQLARERLAQAAV